jgi:hypothetical protein
MGAKQSQSIDNNNSENLTMEQFLDKFNSEIVELLESNDIKYEQLNKEIQGIIILFKNLQKDITKINGGASKKLSKKRPSKKELMLVADENNIKFPYKFSTNKNLKEGLTYALMCKIIVNNEPNILSKNNYITMCNLIGIKTNPNMKKYQLIDLLQQQLN